MSCDPIELKSQSGCCIRSLYLNYRTLVNLVPKSKLQLCLGSVSDTFLGWRGIDMDVSWKLSQTQDLHLKAKWHKLHLLVVNTVMYNWKQDWAVEALAEILISLDWNINRRIWAGHCRFIVIIRLNAEKVQYNWTPAGCCQKRYGFSAP